LAVVRAKPFAINNKGDVVGEAHTDPTKYSPHAFVYHDGKMTDLNGLIDPGLGIYLSSARLINDAGQIIAKGRQPYEHYLLTPSSQVSKISGAVKKPTNALMEGVTVTLSRESSVISTYTTDSSGAYSFVDLLNGIYTVTPSLPDYAFTPKNRTVTLQGKDATENFTGTPVTISGKVIPSKGEDEQVPK